MIGRRRFLFRVVAVLVCVGERQPEPQFLETRQFTIEEATRIFGLRFFSNSAIPSCLGKGR